MDAASPAPRLYVGTCAWSFEEWHGVFYPPKLPAGERLAWYARFLPSVEIDSTFYAAPNLHTVRHWVQTTPPDFRFTCKLPKEITHQRKLQASRELLREFLSSVAPLREKLKAMLVQLPPSFTQRRDERSLLQFLKELPREFRFAVEFRAEGWALPRIKQALEEHQVCWVWNDLTPPERQQEGAFEFLPQTTDFLYVRLMGDPVTKYLPNGERRHRYDRLQWPREASLESWAVRMQQYREECTDFLAYANNHFEGFSPATTKRLAARFGRELMLPAAAAVQPEPAAAEKGQLELQL